MSCEVKVLAKSVNPHGIELTSFQLRYWRAIHAELMTHRDFSRCASSSRAVPVAKMLSQVWNDPAGPTHWGVNQPGMQACNQLQGWRRRLAKGLWKTAGRAACVFAWGLMKLGVHKQVANRVLEPWQYIHVVVTATEWANFYELRLDAGAQPEFRELAQEMRLRDMARRPMELEAGQWHVPYVSWVYGEDDSQIFDVGIDHPVSLEEAIMCSTARCARSSYMNHGDKNVSLDKDLDLHFRLVGSTPRHASPTEHQAQALADDTRVRNLRGFRQYRDFLEQDEAVA